MSLMVAGEVRNWVEAGESSSLFSLKEQCKFFSESLSISTEQDLKRWEQLVISRPVQKKCPALLYVTGPGTGALLSKET